ncbi:hypothetical protein ACIBO2_17575 [Nonomuraea sp. NPDC050022]|uniref:hypothetical protein n=1 Tax=unclassified Nonomuraea TaxID=2593643 RepID=UPI0033CD5495
MSLWSKLKKATTRKKTRQSPPVATAKGLAGTIVLTKPKRSDSLVELSPLAPQPKAPVNPPSEKQQPGSFTSNRRDIIADVIEHNDKVGSAEAFIDLVNAAFTDEGVNPAAPHTHLVKTP